MSGYSKKKEKRSRTNSNEANTSFVKNVTSKVTGLLPATIAKWFSIPTSPSSELPKSNGSLITGDATDSSTDDEASETLTSIHPPAKRMRLSPPAKFNHFSPNDTSVSSLHDLEPITTYSNTPSPSRKEYNTSFLELHIPKSESHDQVEKSSNVYQPQHSISSTALGTGSRKRKSIFDTPSSSGTKSKISDKSSYNASENSMMPAFKPCLLGSPFYTGRTMYGGAAASYINQPHVKQQKPAVVNETCNKVNTISHSALRVMDLLEQYSSPVSEAKRIPIIPRKTSKETVLSRLESLANTQTNSPSYKTQELYVPSIASVLRVKQRSRLVNTTNVARQILASHSSTSDQPYVSINNQKRITPSEESSSSHNYTTKIKSRLTRTRKGNVTEEIPPEPVNLPVATLEIDQSKLLNFSFGIKPVSSLQESTKPTDSSKATVSVPVQPKLNSTVTSTNEKASYQFSRPLKVASPVNVVNNIANSEFKFVSPERKVDQTNSLNNTEKDLNIMITLHKKTEVASRKSKDWQCGDCWIFNKADIEKCVCCGGKKPSTNEDNLKCSVCKVSEKQHNSDKCVDCEKTPVISSNWPIKKDKETSKWKCDDCWVENDVNVDKCLCCGAVNTKKAAVLPATIKLSTSTSSEEWKCDDCWIKNKKSDDKCAACGSSKPGPKRGESAVLNTVSAPRPLDNTFKGLIKSQSDKWECKNCLVLNCKERGKCVCCESEKPGTTSEKKIFNFDTKTNVTFKFGIDPKIQENNIPKAVEIEVPENKSKETESEKNNNVLSKTPTFTFGLPTKKVGEEPKLSQVNAEPTMTFTFGVPQSVSINSTSSPPTAPTFTFGSKVTEQSKSESNNLVERQKLQEVPKIDFSSLKSQTDATKNAEQKLPVLFSLPVKLSQPVQKNNLLFSTQQKPTEKEECPVSTNVAVTVAKPVITFTFSSSATKTSAADAAASAPAPQPSSGAAPVLFGADKTASTPAAAPVLFGADKTASTPAAPIAFSSPAPAASSAPATSTPPTTTAPTATNAPLFGFGNTKEKPKFNFTFGGQNKSETPGPLFGNTKPDGPSPLFGNTKSDATAPLFGSTKTDSPASVFNNIKTDAPPSLFGNAKTEAPAPLFGIPKTDGSAPLFGHAKTETPPNLFGNTQTDTNLFSTPGKSEAPLFGTPAKTDSPLFGSNTKPNLFGNTSKSESPLFGSTTTKTDAPLFGNAAKSEAPLFGKANKTESPMFKFGSSAESNTGANKFGGNLFGSNSKETPAFGSGTAAVALFPGQKPAAFSFASTPVFGASTPAFGSNEATPPPLFGAGSPAPTGNMFGAQPAGGAASSLFGTPGPATAPAFGTPNNTIPPMASSTLAPAFTFGTPQNSEVFGFGEQQQQQTAAGGGVYTFGGGAGAGAAPLQFSMGAGAAGQPPRRVRKAARRNLPR